CRSGILHRLNRACDLDQLAGGDSRIGEGAGLDEFHAALTSAPKLAFEPALEAPGLQRVLAITIKALKCARTSAAWWKQKHQRSVADRTMFDRALSHAMSVLLRSRNVTYP